jgi:hypothetical protein
MKTVSLIHNTIVGGKFYTAGDPINEAILPPNLRKYIAAKPGRRAPPPTEHNLMFEANRPYSLDSETGFMKPAPGRQAAEMEAIAFQDDLITEEAANREVSETEAAAMAQATEDYQADVQRQKTNAEYQAKQSEAAQEYVREQQDANVESGEFDQWDSRREDATNVVSPEAKPKRPMLKRYINRNGMWLRVQKLKRRHPGEVVYVREGKGKFTGIGVVGPQGELPVLKKGKIK